MLRELWNSHNYCYCQKVLNLSSLLGKGIDNIIITNAIKKAQEL